MNAPNPVDQMIEWCTAAGYQGGAPRGTADGAIFLHDRFHPVSMALDGDDIALMLGVPVPAGALQGGDALPTDRLAHLVDHTATLRAGRMTGSLVDGAEGLLARFTRLIDKGAGRGAVLDALADLDRCRLDFHELVELDRAAAAARRATAELTEQLARLGDDIAGDISTT